MRFKRRVVLVGVLVVLFIFLINLSTGNFFFSFPRFSLVDRVVVNLFQPLQGGIRKATISLGRLWTNYVGLVGLKKEFDQIKDELAYEKLVNLSLKERLRTLQEVNKFGSVTLDLPASFDQLATVKARVISFDPMAISKTLWISAGEKNGVKVDQPVMGLEGLVGRIVRVFPTKALVLLLIDSRFAVDVIDESTRIRAMVVGLGGDVELKRYPFLTHLEYLNLGDEINPGDLLLTSGLSDLYPKGLPVGNVIQVEKGEGTLGSKTLFQTAVVLPSVDFTKLEEVMIITSIE